MNKWLIVLMWNVLWFNTSVAAGVLDTVPPVSKLQEEQRRRHREVQEQQSVIVPEPLAIQNPEFDAWNDAQRKHTRKDYQTYLGKYPNGEHVDEARARLKKINDELVAKDWPKGKNFQDCTDCPEMVVIPTGEFMMGSSSDEPERSGDEGPQHKVSLVSPLAVGKYEITFAEWNACFDAKGCNYRADDFGWGIGHDIPVIGKLPIIGSLFQKKIPVINVSWNDAQDYVKWLSAKTGKPYRLLSEAEWEYACRAGGSHRYCGSNNLEEVGWYAGNSKEKIGKKDIQKSHEIGKKRPNAFGLYDMTGNVWEWVQDCWHDDYKDAPTDGSAWQSAACENGERVLRGGSWGYFKGDSRAANRADVLPSNRYNEGGFRVVRTILP